tara:strand:- start:455 stop:1720 length:1266 start_codon:yes stop_codon:yes gene_type:complete
MIKVFNFKKSNYTKKLALFLRKRTLGNNKEQKLVKSILSDIKKNGSKAVLKYEKKYSKNSQIKPSIKKINSSIKSLDWKVKDAIDYAYKRIYKFHSAQKIKNISYKDSLGNRLEYKYFPIDSIGVYVPANLPSSVLMNTIPAKIAGVKKIVLVNPKTKGRLDPAVLYAAKKIGVSEILSIGGAQAIGSLAYVQKVNKIIGPGNIFVANAKKELFGQVGLEGMIAGPSEITILADNNSNIEEITTSMIAQAEHDVKSQSILITKSKKLANEVNKKVFGYLKNLPKKKVALRSLKTNGLIILIKDDKQITQVINEIAPEHLEMNVKNYKKYLNKIKNVGSICLGKYSPMAVTDYNAGTNHVLPTLGSAKFSSGLNLSEFYKKISYINLSKKGVEVIGKKAITLAEYEQLIGHAQSIKSRIRRM